MKNILIFFYKSGGVVSDMGYGNPNLFSLYLFFLVIFLVVLKKEINTFLVAFIVFVIYESFYSRTVLFSGCILLVLSFVQKNKFKKNVSLINIYCCLIHL